MGHLAARALGRRDVHHIGRRQFLADLGHRTFAVAILGAGVAACSSSDDGSGESSTPESAAGTSSTSEPEASDAADPAGDSEPATATTDGPALPTLDWAQVGLGNVSAYVLVRGNEAAVVDTGNPGSEDEIGAALATLGVGFGEVGHVVLTHHHPDHIGSLAGVLGEATSAVAYAGEADIENIASPNQLQAVGDGDDVFGLDVINTPGHTPGSISVLDTEVGLLIAGDALNGNDTGTEVLGPNPTFTADLATANESVQKLAARQFAIAAFGHGNPVDGGASELVAQLAAQL